MQRLPMLWDDADTPLSSLVPQNWVWLTLFLQNYQSRLLASFVLFKGNGAVQKD